MKVCLLAKMAEMVLVCSAKNFNGIIYPKKHTHLTVRFAVLSCCCVFRVYVLLKAQQMSLAGASNDL